MGSIAWHIFNGMVFVAWVACIVAWVMRGCPIPKWVHVFAGAMLIAGIAAIVACTISGMFSVKLTLSCLLVPPAAVYVGWLWMFGPSEAEDQKTKEAQNN